MEKLMGGKKQNAHMTLLLMIWRKVFVKKDDKNEKNDDGKEAEYPDDTPPDDMEEGVSERKMTRIKN